MATNKKNKKATATVKASAKPTVKAKAVKAVATKKTSKVASKTSATTLKTNKKVASKVAKPAAKKTAVKPAKTTAKQTAKTKTPPKTSAKKASVAVKAAPKKAVAVKVATKPVKTVKKVEPKAVVKKAVVKAAPTPAPAKLAKKAQPIVVKSPTNQNNTVQKPVAAPAVVLHKTAEGVKAVAAPQAARPAYRPIQVINRPLAPLQPQRQMAPVEPANEKVEFETGDYVVYPAHGVGQIEAIETQTIAGMTIKLYAIVFEKDRMRLKVPVFKAHASGLRRLSSTNRMQDALKTLQGRAQIRRAMWSRRAQEYETKINSGDPVSIAEVLRDLKRSNDDTEQSYSERQIYQSALERLAREVAVVEKISETEAAERLENMIKGRRARKAANESVAVAAA
jgi:CarD family transcriptional regulator